MHSAMRDSPTAAMQHYDTGRGQMKAQASSRNSVQEYKSLATGLAVVVNGADTILVRGAPINTAAFLKAQ